MWSPAPTPRDRSARANRVERSSSSAYVTVSPVEAMTMAGESGVCSACQLGVISRRLRSAMGLPRLQSSDLLRNSEDSSPILPIAIPAGKLRAEDRLSDIIAV